MPVPPVDSGLTDAEKSELLERACVYILPLMLIDATFIKMTNTVEPKPQQSPANQFIHARHPRRASATYRPILHG